MMRSTLLTVEVCCLLAMLLAVAVTADGQERPKDFPNRPITIQVGSVAGGSNDIGVRIVADSLKKIVGQPVLVENKAGAGGQVMLTDFKNNAKPDGYTLAVFVSPGYVTIPLDPARKAAFSMSDFQWVANHVDDPGAVLVRAESPFKTLEEMFEAAKARPGQLSITTTGIGSDDHLAVLDLQRKTGHRFNIVHFSQGTAEALKAVLGGHADVDCDNVGGFLPTVRSGQARILAVMADKRFPDLPDVPTFRERGIDLISSSARGFIAPKGTPPDIVRYLEQALRKAMDDPDHVRRMKDVGLSVKFMGSEEITGFIGREEARAKSLIDLYRK